MRAGVGSIALGAALVAGAASGCKRAPPPPPAAATVDGVAIPVSDVARELSRVRHGADGQLAPDELARLRRTLLDTLVDRQLLLTTAYARGIAVDDARVDKALQRARAEHGDEPLEKLLADVGVPLDEYRRQTRDSLAIQQLIADEVLSRIALAEGEARAAYDAEAAKESSAYDLPDEVHAAQIVVKTAEEAKDVLDRLKRGADFAALARERSLSPDARRDGDLGWFKKGVMPQAFDDACFALTRPGQLSPVTPSQYGFHVFKLLERRAARTVPFDDATRAEVEARLRRDKGAAAQALFVASLRAKAKVVVDEAALDIVR